MVVHRVAFVLTGKQGVCYVLLMAKVREWPTISHSPILKILEISGLSLPYPVDSQEKHNCQNSISPVFC